MIPLRDNLRQHALPLVTWTLIALNVLLFLWDREWRIFGPANSFSDLTMRPNEVMRALSPTGGEFLTMPVVTVFTALFLHANLMHLLGNLLFLFVFGANVEEALGSWRFAVYYLFWGVAASAAHIYMDPNSAIPTLGASGAIGGVLGCYFLLFPANKIEILVPPFFIPVEASAWVLLGLWFLYQIFIPQTGVANWAHAGGFLAGMLTVLIAGGRRSVLKGKEHLLDQDFGT